MSVELQQQGYVYLYHPRMFYESKTHVYRLDAYPRNEHKLIMNNVNGNIIILFGTDDHLVARRDLLQIFNKQFDCYANPASGLFCGDPVAMCSEIINYMYPPLKIHISNDEKNIAQPKTRENVVIAQPAKPADVKPIPKLASALSVTEVDIDRAHDFLDKFIRSGVTAAAKYVKQYALPENPQSDSASATPQVPAEEVLVTNAYSSIRAVIMRLETLHRLDKYQFAIKESNLGFVIQNKSPKCSVPLTVVDLNIFIMIIAGQCANGQTCEAAYNHMIVYNTIVGLGNAICIYVAERMRMAEPLGYVRFMLDVYAPFSKVFFNALLKSCSDYETAGDTYKKTGELYLAGSAAL